MRYRPASAPFSIPRNLLFAIGTVIAAAWSTPKIEDIILHLSGAAEVEIRFAPGEDPGTFPAFFQKADSANRTLLLSFLETETSLPLQTFDLPADAPLVGKIEMRRLRSPSGKLFLGVEFALRKSPDPKSPWQARPKGANALSFALGKVPKKAAFKAWSLNHSLSAPPVEPAAPPAPEAVEPPKTEPVAAVPEPKAPESVPAVAEPAAPAPVKAPEPAKTAKPEMPPEPKTEPAPAAPSVETAVARKTIRLIAVKVAVSNSREEIAFVFEGKENPEYTMESAPGIAGNILKFSRVQSDSVPAKYDLGKNGWIRSIRWKQGEESATVLVVTDSALVPTAMAGKGKLTFAFPRRAGHPAYSWSSKEPAKLPKPAIEPALSAHAEGHAKEAAKPEGLSSGKVFTVAGTGKSMTVVKDSVALSSKPAKEASHKFLFAGETVRRLGTSGNFVRLVSGTGDTGFVRSTALAYADELSASTIRAIEAKVKTRNELASAPTPPPTPVPAPEAPKEPAVAEPTQPKTEPAAPAEPAMPAEPSAPKPAVAEPVPPKKGPKGKKAAPVPEPAPAEPSLSMPTQADEARLGLSPEALAAEKRKSEAEKVDLAPKNVRVSYNSFGRRDPFIPLEQGGADQGIDIDQMKLVGIVKENDEPLAVLENIRDINISYTVRQGDPIHNGRVSRIAPESVTFDLTEFGISRSFTLKLVPSQERTGK